MTYLMIGLFPSFGARHDNFIEVDVISVTSGGKGESGTSTEIRNKLHRCSGMCITLDEVASV